MEQTVSATEKFYSHSIASLVNIVYYNDNHKLNDSPTCTALIAHEIGCTWSLASTMPELMREIEYGSDCIAFHIEMIARSGMTVEEFVHSIITLSRFAPGQQTLKIMAVIKPTTPRDQVQILQHLPVSIGLDINYYTIEQTSFSCLELIAGRRYWPAELIDALPAGNNLPVSVYFRADADTYVTADMIENLKKNALCRVQFCSNWDELGDALKNHPHQLVFHIGMLTRLDLSVTEIIESLQTRMQLSLVSIPIGVGINSDTPISVVKELKRLGIFGIVPSAGHWGTVETVMALNSMASRIPYWPRHIMDQLPGNKPTVKKPSTGGGKLTTRQQEVMDLICRRGLSNKQIAKSLNLSESTVKIHVSSVMKVYGVRNRTQLALSAGTGLSA